MNSTKRLLKNREIELKWVNPESGLDINGNEVDSIILSTASVQDCINMSRTYAASHDRFDLTDEELLDEFIVTFWAEEV